MKINKIFKNIVLAIVMLLIGNQSIVAMRGKIKNIGLFATGALSSSTLIPIAKRSYDYKNNLAPEYVQKKALEAYNFMNPQQTFFQKLQAFWIKKMGYLNIYEIENPSKFETANAYTKAVSGGIFFPKNTYKQNKELTAEQKHTLFHEVTHNACGHTTNPIKIIKSSIEKSITGNDYCYQHEVEAQTGSNFYCYQKAQTIENIEEKEKEKEKLYKAIEVDLLDRAASSDNDPYKNGGYDSFIKILNDNPNDKKLQEIHSEYKKKLKEEIESKLHLKKYTPEQVLYNYRYKDSINYETRLNIVKNYEERIKIDKELENYKAPDF